MSVCLFFVMLVYNASIDGNAGHSPHVVQAFIPTKKSSDFGDLDFFSSNPSISDVMKCLDN